MTLDRTFTHSRNLEGGPARTSDRLTWARSVRAVAVDHADADVLVACDVIIAESPSPMERAKAREMASLFKGYAR